MQNHNQDPVSFCEEAIRTGENKDIALMYAQYIESNFLSVADAEVKLSKEEFDDYTQLRSIVMTIVATVYVWNNQFELAYNLESEFINNSSLWNNEEIKVFDIYLIHLIIQKQTQHLDLLFKNESIRNEYLSFEDVYKSSIDPTYHFLSNGGIFVNTVNRVNAYSRVLIGKNLL